MKFLPLDSINIDKGVLAYFNITRFYGCVCVYGVQPNHPAPVLRSTSPKSVHVVDQPLKCASVWVLATFRVGRAGDILLRYLCDLPPLSSLTAINTALPYCRF